MITGRPAGAEKRLPLDHNAKKCRSARRRADRLRRFYTGQRPPAKVLGVHICTGPVAVKDAQAPATCWKFRISSTYRAAGLPKPPDFEGQVFGSSVAAWWGYHYNELLARTEAARGGDDLRDLLSRDTKGDHNETPIYAPAPAVYSYRWGSRKNRSVRRRFTTTYDYPGVAGFSRVTVSEGHNVLDGHSHSAGVRIFWRDRG